MRSARRGATGSCRARALILALVPVMGLGACAGGSAKDAGGTRTSGKEAPRIVMELVAYKPDRLEVSPGTKVTWTQKDAGFHTVTSGVVEQAPAGVIQKPDGKFDSGEIATGATYSFTFEAPGTYPFFCRIHPATMRGEVSVR